MKKDRYTPTQEELKAADNLLTDEQRKASEIRAENFEQEQPPWADFEGTHIDENFVRKLPNPEQKQLMDQRIRELANIFDDPELKWHLDGALNISLLRGEYIGYHKDIDLSFKKEDLPKLEESLLKKGYGLFLSTSHDEDPRKKIMRRVGYAEFAETPAEHPLIAAIDENGKIQYDKAANFMDAHIMEFDQDGFPIGQSGVKLPKKWGEPYPVIFQGNTINLSHPGKVLYYKLHQGRNYDKTDIRKLIETGKISDEDISDVERLYESEFEATKARGLKVFQEIFSRLEPDMKPEDILKVIMGQPEFNAKSNPEYYLGLAKRIYDSPVKTAEGILDNAIDFFGFNEMKKNKRKEIAEVRKYLDDYRAAQKVKENIEQI